MIANELMTPNERQRVRRLAVELHTLRETLEGRDPQLLRVASAIARDAADAFDDIAERWESEPDTEWMDRV